MRHRLCGTATAVVGLWVMAVPATGQTETTVPKTLEADVWVPALTPDGQPDIQGVWEGGGGFDARNEKGVEPPQTTVGPVDQLGRAARGAPDCRASRESGWHNLRILSSFLDQRPTVWSSRS